MAGTLHQYFNNSVHSHFYNKSERFIENGCSFLSVTWHKHSLKTKFSNKSSNCKSSHFANNYRNKPRSVNIPQPFRVLINKIDLDIFVSSTYADFK